MIQIIKMIDVDVDECGYIKVEGETELTNGVIERTKKAIEKYKAENDYEYDIDTIIDVACGHLQSEGYSTKTVSYDYCIEF